MKATIIAALTAGASAHYVFPSVVYNGVTTAPWTAVRQWNGYESNAPVTDVSSLDIRCNVGGSTSSIGTAITTVKAGSTMGFTSNPAIYHPGPAQVYLAKVPSGASASTWDGDGAVWFKIYSPAAEITSSSIAWPSMNQATISFTLPADLPSGQYLARFEQIGLHVASAEGGAQFYLSCAGINVTGGGSGTPGPLVAFPGAYSATDPGIMIDIYYPIPQTYTAPGPKVWSG